MKKRKSLPILLALAMVLPMIPMVVFADDGAVAKIGDKGYDSMDAAVAEVLADNTPTTIVLQDDYTGAGVKVNDKQNIIFDLNGYTWTIDGTVGSTGTETNAMQLLEGSTVEIKNGTITSEKAKILIQKYGDLTLKDVVLDGSHAQYTLSNNCGQTVIGSGAEVIAADNGIAFDLYYWPSGGYTEGVSVTVEEGAKITGDIEYARDNTTTDGDTVEKAKLNINGGEIYGEIKTNIKNAPKGITITGGIFNANLSAYMKNAILVETDKEGIYTAYTLEEGQETSDLAMELGAVYFKDGIYYFNKPSVEGVEQIAYQIVLHYTTPDGKIGEDISYITVPMKKGAAVKDGIGLVMGELPVIPNESKEYRFIGWYDAVLNGTGTSVAEYKGTALTLDTEVTGDMVMYGAWEKVDGDSADTTADSETKPDSSAQTGDDFNMAIPFAAAGFALAAAAAVVATRKRHN